MDHFAELQRIADILENKEKKIADMQRLCERALYILGENWNDFTDKDGHGPSSLLRDLEKVVNGKEHRELRLMNDRLVKICNDQANRIKELERR